MPRIISPPKEELSELRSPLNKGERAVFEFFDRHLNPEWEIYVQPHLNGLRPDFVLLHPEVGIAVFEVKDWNFDAVEYRLEIQHGNAPILMGQKDGTSFVMQRENPIEKVLLYKEEIYNLYCPRLEKQKGAAAITAGVIFPFADEIRVQSLFAPSLAHRKKDGPKAKPYHPISGIDALKSGDIKRVFPESVRTQSRYMNPLLAQDLRNWLVEPDFSSTQRQPLELNEKQRGFATSRTATGYRRIKGPAGSGKSMVLAARAAQLLLEEKSVLVVTYNLTLLHYLKDLSVRWSPAVNARRDVTWLGFHSWCKRVCSLSGRLDEYKALWRQHGESGDTSRKSLNDILRVQLPRLAAEAIEKDRERAVDRYDAVLVDEGQDLLPAEWDALKRARKPDGEMVLVADTTQDIYGTARSWTDAAMEGAGFRGDWAKLDESYRLPPQALDYARRFAEMFLPADLVDIPMRPPELDLFPCTLKWVQVDKERAVERCKREILDLAPSADPNILSIPDITFLVATERFGKEVIDGLQELGIKTVHTFSEDQRERRRRKVGFYMGDARVKATTLHSFKGWEARALVLYVSDTLSEQQMALVYTGLTRIKRHSEGSFLTVVSSLPDLDAFGRTWPDYVSA